jgi:hypothetical protein
MARIKRMTEGRASLVPRISDYCLPSRSLGEGWTADLRRLILDVSAEFQLFSVSAFQLFQNYLPAMA